MVTGVMRVILKKALLAVFCLALTTVAGPRSAAAQDHVPQGPVPAWVTPTVETRTLAADGDAPIRFLMIEQQFRMDESGSHAFAHVRARILTPQGLAFAGNVAMAWSPEGQDVVVHDVLIIRGEEIIDVLKGQEFTVLRREQNLETASLNGILTATLQPAGLRVGDTLDFAYSINTHHRVLGSHGEFLGTTGVPGVIDRLHVSASWPADRRVRVRATDGWTAPRVQTRAGFSSVVIDQTDLQPIAIPPDAPARFGQVRQLEVTDYQDWGDFAAVMAPLYLTARTLSENSELLAEIDRIKALSDDPLVRTAAALRLVQDEVRYVALNMGDAGLVPATADETWRRRFGDCKGKTALLLALLDALQIKATPAAVSVGNGDGLDERLPVAGVFDHVLVKAEIDGVTYWIDGASSGDRELSSLNVPPYRWALPLVAGARLEALVQPPLAIPSLSTTVDVDASAGLYAKAPVTADMVIHGAQATALNGLIGAASTEQKNAYIREIFALPLFGVEITSVDTVYDRDRADLHFRATGSLVLSEQVANNGLRIPNSTVDIPLGEAREAGPYRDVPIAIAHPTYIIGKTTLRLPVGGAGFSLNGDDIAEDGGGYQVRRNTTLSGDTVIVETSLRSLQSEVSEPNAEAARTALETANAARVRLIAPFSYSATAGDREAWAVNEPKTSAEYVTRALALDSAGDRDAAIAAYDRAVALDPRNANALANRALILLRQGHRDAAKADLDRASEIDPSERIAMNGHAMIALRDGDLDEALVEISRGLRQKPDDLWSLLFRATVYRAQGETDKAVRDFDAAIATGRGDSIQLKLQRIAALVEGKRNTQAMTDMRALAVEFPTNRVVTINLAALLIDAEDYVGAREALDRVAPLYEDNSALKLRAGVLIKLNELDLAAADLAKMREGAGDSANAYNDLCWIQAEEGAFLEQAAKDCDRALELEPTSASFLDSRGLVLLQTGDYQAALDVYDRVLALDPNLETSLYGRGLAREALGQTEEGAADKAAAIAKYAEVGKPFRVFEQRRAQRTAAR